MGSEMCIRDRSEVVLPSDSSEGEGLSRRIGWVKDLERRLPIHALRFRRVRSYESDPRLSAHSQFSLLSNGAKKAIRLYAQFIDEATVSSNLAIDEIELFESAGRMVIDTMTRKNLELMKTAREGSYDGSLLHFLDRNSTQAGSRELRNWLLQPLLDKEKILKRQSAISVSYTHLTLPTICSV